MIIDKRTVMTMDSTAELFKNVDFSNSLTMKFNTEVGRKRKPVIREMSAPKQMKNKNALF